MVQLLLLLKIKLSRAVLLRKLFKSYSQAFERQCMYMCASAFESVPDKHQEARGAEKALRKPDPKV